MTGTKELVKADKSRMLTSFDELEKWFETMWSRPSSLFGSSLWPASRLMDMKELSPSVDIYEEGNELVMKADLPGVKRDEITIDLSGSTLTISGEKKQEEKLEKENYYRYERCHGSFHRSFELPEGIDRDKVSARFEDGVLEVRIPKTEEEVSKSKKIPIT
ncbi:MAG: Hsp20/alpha crystallin family protein [Thermodesulfovibrionales bacterium]